MVALNYHPLKGSGRAWVRRIRLINWHGHENATLDVYGDMLAVIGENGSGKSLILDAIDWALFPTSGKVFNAAAREGGRISRRTLSNTILFFDPHGVDRPDRGWRRQRTVGYCGVEVEHEGEGRWVYGSGAVATPQSAHPFYYALPATVEQITFLETTPQGATPLQMQDFRARNEGLISASSGGGVFNATQLEDYNRLVARRLLNIEGADWQRRYEALYDVLHRMLGLKVDDGLVADPSGVVREFLPVVDRPHLERLVEGLESIQRIHRDIDEYAKLRATLAGVVEARRAYHDAALRHAALTWLRSAWESDDSARTLTQAGERLHEAESGARQAEAAEETAYAEENSARRELEALQQLHQGEVVQAVGRANDGLEATQFEQDRAAREQRVAEERLQRSETSLASARQALDQEVSSARVRLTELNARASKALGALPGDLGAAWERMIAQPADENLADALHAAWVSADGALGGLDIHAQRIREAVAHAAETRQIEREARAQQEAASRALQTTRQATWARWEKLTQRWPEGLGRAPTAEPSTIALPPLAETARQGLDEARALARDAGVNAARLEVSLAELEKRIKALDGEIAQTKTEPIPPLSPQRERALEKLRAVDPNVEPAYRQLDLAREGLPWAEAIEGLLEHTDTLTMLLLDAPLDRAHAAAPNEVDWHALAVSGTGKQQRGSLAAALTTNAPDLRRHLDTMFGAMTLAQEPPRSGDFLCTDGRYRLGDVTGVIRPRTRSQSLIGVVRRQSAAAARREELQREQAGLRDELRRGGGELQQERQNAKTAESRATSLSEMIHMLEEIEQRRGDMRSLREGDETASLRLAAATREAEEAARDERDARDRWAEVTHDYPALANDAAALERARQALAQAIADTVARAAETRVRLAQLGARLRSAEETHSAEFEAYGMARAYLDQCERKTQEAQRLLNEARSALRAAGLEDFEARITQLQRRLKSAEEQARKAGVAKGIALHQLEATQQARQTMSDAATHAATTLEKRTAAFGQLLTTVADSLDLPANQVDDPARYARQITKGRDSRNRLDDDLPRAFSQAEREQESFLVAVGGYQALVGADDRFGLRAPAKTELTLAPQGWLMDVAPRLEGTSDIRLLLSFLDTSIDQLQKTLAERVTRVVRDIILGEVVSHLVEQLRRAQSIIEGLNERLATARFFARNTRFSMKLSVRLTRHPDIPFDHVTIATALLEHGHAMPAGVQAQLTQVFAFWLDEQMRGQTQPSVEAIVEQLDYRRWVDISLLHSDDMDARVRPWDSAVSGFGSGGEQRVPVYVLLLTAAAMQFAVSNAPLRLLMHDEAFARMDQRNADLVIRFAQQLGMGLVIASPNLDLFAEGVKYATAYRLRQLPSGLIAREALHLKAVGDEEDEEEGPGALN